LNPAQQKQIESLQVSYRHSGGDWTDNELIEQFLAAIESEDSTETWFLARWNSSQPRSGGLVVRIYCPRREAESETFHSLLDSLHLKLMNGLSLSTKEKGWPVPRFSIQVYRQDEEETWAYQLVLGPFQTEPCELHPNKILAVGDEGALSSLLGLEAMDPVFGLPAKWVTFSQSERAAQQGCLLFEASEVAMGHAINFLSTRMEHAIGLWEINRWLSTSLPSRGAETCRQLQEDAAFLLRLVRHLMSEGLNLPPAERFCEHLQVARAETTDRDEIEMLVRREVVNDNLRSWLDADGMLNAIEWKGPDEVQSSPHLRMLDRLTRAAEQVTSRATSGRPVLLVDISYRTELATALKSLFPDLPVLAWSDLKDLSNIQVLVSVNATLSVDPPAVPVAFFSTTL
jgi:flagellar biosynthesis component FlhA